MLNTPKQNASIYPLQKVIQAALIITLDKSKNLVEDTTAQGGEEYKKQVTKLIECLTTPPFSIQALIKCLEKTEKLTELLDTLINIKHNKELQELSQTLKDFSKSTKDLKDLIEENDEKTAVKKLMQALERNTNAVTQNTKLSIETKVIDIYGDREGNWGDLKIFAGSYINFGYWKDIDITKNVLTPDERIQSSRKLYEYTLKKLDYSLTDNIVELGCGRGVGMLQSFDCKKVQKVQGFDITPAQIYKAKQEQRAYFPATSSCIEFVISRIDSLPIKSKSIDKVYSVEVLQHVTDFSTLAKEISRILKPEGKFVFVADFSRSEEGKKRLTEEHLFIDDIEIFEPIENVTNAFKSENFTGQCESIGKHVFDGYKKWVHQEVQDPVTLTNTNKIFEAYEKDYIDYYACTFTLYVSHDDL